MARDESEYAKLIRGGVTFVHRVTGEELRFDACGHKPPHMELRLFVTVDGDWDRAERVLFHRDQWDVIVAGVKLPIRLTRHESSTVMRVWCQLDELTAPVFSAGGFTV